MSARPGLVFDRVWKRFKRGSSHDSLRDLIPALTRRLGGRARERDTSQEFWALRDLSFEVGPGDVLGIIGHNGAGKSTTLKILNRIMDPSFGHVHVTGKVGALIEVSAGFHQDLTGRQNVFLQGAIMGMPKAEVARKFDEIVEFAELSDFIDTPVKRYSSGMNARLGFSIAAHLEPDVLIIDEVLAVGDHNFQQKAFGRIKSLARSGIPVVLVSHQLDRINELCNHVILLQRGAVRAEGTASYCIDEYLHGAANLAGEASDAEFPIRFGGPSTPMGSTAYSGARMQFGVEGTMNPGEFPAEWTMLFRVINAHSGQCVYAVFNTDRKVPLPAPGPFEYVLDLQMNVPPGMYFVDAGIHDLQRGNDIMYGPRTQIEVLERNRFWGAIQMNATWTVVPAHAPDHADDDRSEVAVPDTHATA